MYHSKEENKMRMRMRMRALVSHSVLNAPCTTITIVGYINPCDVAPLHLENML